MGYVRHMDPSMNRVLRQQIIEDAATLTQRFCQAVSHRNAMRRLEDQFQHFLDSYVRSALLDEKRYSMQYREELCKTITRAKVISHAELEKEGVRAVM